MPQAQPELKRVSRRSLHAPLSHKLEREGPNLFQYLDKRVFVALNGSRKVMGTLRGYDVCTPKIHQAEVRANLLLGLPQRCSGRCS